MRKIPTATWLGVSVPDPFAKRGLPRLSLVASMSLRLLRQLSPQRLQLSLLRGLARSEISSREVTQLLLPVLVATIEREAHCSSVRSWNKWQRRRDPACPFFDEPSLLNIQCHSLPTCALLAGCFGWSVTDATSSTRDPCPADRLLALPSHASSLHLAGQELQKPWGCRQQGKGPRLRLHNAGGALSCPKTKTASIHV